MIILLTGPSGAGKTDASFALLQRLRDSVYLDSDWFCAKNPLDPLSRRNIGEVYDILALLIRFHRDRGVGHFIVPLYLAAAARYAEFGGVLAPPGEPVVFFSLACRREALLERIRGRDRLPEQKAAEEMRIDGEREEAGRLVRSISFIREIETTGRTSGGIAEMILAEIGTIGGGRQGEWPAGG